MILGAGFADPVHDAQRAFRAALNALSRPGMAVPLGQAIANVPLGGAMAHCLLALADDDTPVWWQRSSDAVHQWLRFHTGAGVALASQDAVFACIVDAQGMPALSAFAQASAQSPEFSTTLFVELPALDGGPPMQWQGPGIDGCLLVALNGLPAGFWDQWQVNHAAFPQGVDLVLTCGDQALGLPRTTRVSGPQSAKTVRGH